MGNAYVAIRANKKATEEVAAICDLNGFAYTDFLVREPSSIPGRVRETTEFLVSGPWDTIYQFADYALHHMPGVEGI
jgi:hypothetical protein